MANRESVLWDIWTTATNGELLNVGRRNGWRDTPPETIVELWKADRVRLNGSCPDGEYKARAYVETAMDNFGD